MMSATPRVRTRSNLHSTTAVAKVCPADLRLPFTYREIGELKASSRKLRRANKQQIEHLTASIRKFGIVRPVLTRGNTIVTGHLLFEAARLTGLKEVPTIDVSHLSEEEARALRIALHKIESMSSWDEVALKEELTFLSNFDFELVTFTAFSSAEIDVMLNAPAAVSSDEADDRLPPLPSEPISRLGDVWIFKGGHRLGCFNALEAVSYNVLMSGEKAGLVFCDPPYNVLIKGNVTGRSDAREFAMASGEMTAAEFTGFLNTTFEHLAHHSKDGSLSLQFMDFRHMREMLEAGHAVYGELLNLCVWAKTNPGMGSLWRSQHELCFVWKNGTEPHVNNVELGRHGRNRSNVWWYPGMNTGGRAADAYEREHVTPKNARMIQDAILDVSRRGDIVLDVFAGSSTTLVAAHRAKRRGYGMELDPLYVDLGVRRMEKATNAEAHHAETGKTFAETAAERGIAPGPRRQRA